VKPKVRSGEAVKALIDESSNKRNYPTEPEVNLKLAVSNKLCESAL